jgi:hypothetical protein
MKGISLCGKTQRLRIVGGRRPVYRMGLALGGAFGEDTLEEDTGIRGRGLSPGRLTRSVFR